MSSEAQRGEKKAQGRARYQVNREKVKANTDKKAIQRAYEASNLILQEERKAYREAKKAKKVEKEII